MTRRERIFAYGTLRDPRVQAAVIGRVVSGSPAAIGGFRLDSIGAGPERYPILRRGEDEIDGRVFEITAAELERVDAYEGVAYRRVRVETRSGLECWVYVASEASDELGRE